MRIAAIVGAALLVSTGAHAQDETARKVAVESMARVPLERPVKGAPYSADTVVEGFQSLADGNRIVKKTTGRVYRDGEGRVRREEDNARGMTISIVDPVGGFSYSLNPDTKVAWKTPIGTLDSVMAKMEEMQVAMRKAQSQDAPSVAARQEQEKAKVAAAEKAARDGQTLTDADKEKIARAGGGRGGGGGFGIVAPGGGAVGEMRARGGNVNAGPLEHKTIEGVAVQGRKTTTVIPAGQVGNEQPLTITSEEWSSPDLNVLIMTRHSDPRTGESSYRLTNIIRAEPDRSLFMVPADYTVRETGIRRNQQQ
jgi:hypothetical protein